MRKRDVALVRTELDRLRERLDVLAAAQATRGRLDEDDHFWPGQEVAAVRRASLDLSAALVAMRRS